MTLVCAEWKNVWWFRKLLYDSSKIIMKELYTIFDLHGTPLIVNMFGQWFGQPDQNFSQTALRTYEWWIYEIWPLSVGKNSSFCFLSFFWGGGVNLSKHIISLKIKYLYLKKKKRNLKNFKMNTKMFAS